MSNSNIASEEKRRKSRSVRERFRSWRHRADIVKRPADSTPELRPVEPVHFASIEDEEAALGNWPRRLLHVPTMTSHEWQPGNRYGGVEAPPYNAITYTWGRWRLEEGEEPDVEALTVHGIPWEMPRVKPICFSNAQFLHIIQRTVLGASTFHGGTPMDKHNLITEFLWLDVACIDQRSNEPRSSSEIGRQAAIFKGARYVFAWLSATPHDKLEKALITLERLAWSIERRLFPGRDPMIPESVYGSQTSSEGSEDDAQTSSQGSDDDADLPCVEDSMILIHQAFRDILSDPWFSSLWTLQEAFLRLDAVMLSCQGIATSNPGTLFHAAISELIHYSGPLIDIVPDSSAFSELHNATVRLIEQAGIAALGTENPLVVYAASEDRSCSRPEDRIYGIQQIFDFRLGSSVANDADKFFTRAQLEVQFGEHLLQHHPVLSQMHVFTQPAPQGTAWLVAPSSVVPSDVVSSRGFGIASLQNANGPAFSTRNVNGSTWGHFDGAVCSFRVLERACVEFEQLRQEVITSPRARNQRVLTVHLDKTEELQNLPDFEPETGGLARVTRATIYERQKRLCAWLAHTFGEGDLQVLQLGPTSRHGPNHEYQDDPIGLILLRRDDPFTHYHRLGICWWNTTGNQTLGGGHIASQAMTSFLEGEGALWARLSGIFG